MKDSMIDRRQVLTGGVIAALGLLWKPGDARADEVPPGAEGATAAFDVACLGHTMALNVSSALNAAKGDLRGASFSVEGNLYPAGTIPAGNEFDPAAVASLGHWFCRGWLIADPERPLPDSITTQEYLLGRISSQQYSPADQLTSSGVEGGVPLVVRSVTGGTGRYKGAGGEVYQQQTGANKTILNDGSNMLAPNFRFYFKL